MKISEDMSQADLYNLCLDLNKENIKLRAENSKLKLRFKYENTDTFSKGIKKELENRYLIDDRPWVIGFSGGKDSTCLTQLVYNMLKELPPDKREKEVIILSSNTLVESPLILDRMLTVFV